MSSFTKDYYKPQTPLAILHEIISSAKSLGANQLPVDGILQVIEKYKEYEKYVICETYLQGLADEKCEGTISDGWEQLEEWFEINYR